MLQPLICEMMRPVQDCWAGLLSSVLVLRYLWKFHFFVISRTATELFLVILPVAMDPRSLAERFREHSLTEPSQLCWKISISKANLKARISDMKVPMSCSALRAGAIQDGLRKKESIGARRLCGRAKLNLVLMEE